MKQLNYAWIGESGETLHPVRKTLLEYILEHGEASPVELHRKLHIGLSTVSYHMKAMREYKTPWIVFTKEIPRRGSMEHFYKLTPELILDDTEEKAA